MNTLSTSRYIVCVIIVNFAANLYKQRLNLEIIMDHRRLVELVRQMPQIWDRNCPMFRDKDARENAWEDVAKKIGITAATCKDAFKSLREKYLREREKAQHQGDHYTPWELFYDLKFLDPHILSRPAVWNGSSVSEDDISVNSDSDPTNFDKQLIHLVRKASPIWDRNSNTYPNKTSKNQLWENIASTLNKDVNSCMLRWKALREKYIRQKAKFQEGEAKWELLDDMAFLDKVIQYRRKQSDFATNQNDSAPTPSSSRYPQRNHSDPYSGYQDNTNFKYIRCNVDRDDYNCTDSSNEFLNIIKEEHTVQQVADSSYNSPVSKRIHENSAGGCSDTVAEKRARLTENATPTKVVEEKENKSTEKSAEQLFGDLVASLLSKKPENQRNLYMIEIMTVLSK